MHYRVLLGLLLALALGSNTPSAPIPVVAAPLVRPERCVAAQLEVDLSYSRANLSSVATGDLFYDGYIARTTGIYQFSREMFLRVIGQYDEFGRQVNLYPLLSYKLSPYTIFYAGSTYTLSDFGEPFGFPARSIRCSMAVASVR